jgi:RNA polymerase sigma-70 factor (ECF subfamily)
MAWAMVGIVTDRTRLAAGAKVPAHASELRLRAIFDAEFDFVWRALRRLGLDEGAADDAAQETFVVAARKLATIEVGRERSFLFGTAVRIAANVRRTRDFRDRREAAARGDSRASAEPASDAPLPDAQLEQRQALGRLQRALDGLPDDLRDVLVLVELDALPQPEIAALLGVPLGTVASRLRRARQNLAALLEEQELPS